MGPVDQVFLMLTTVLDAHLLSICNVLDIVQMSKHCVSLF